MTAAVVGSVLFAALAVVVGGGALLLFAVYLFAGFPQVVDLGLGPLAALAWDAGLCGLFFLQHSGMVRRPVRGRIERAFGDHLAGVVYTFASGAALLVCLLLWQRSGESVVLDGAAYWLARLLFALAIAGFFWGAGALGSFDTLGIRPVLDRVRQRDTRPVRLAVRGPYRWVRHPLYLFALVLFWSCPVLSADRLLFNVLWSVWVVVGAVLEERDLVDEFGDDYRAYQRGVPMLLPRRLRPYRP